mgnify:CR=1 FL=1|tara:strand:- start:9181 stop:9561 length:381 start_codon:yes stop_codon:yes gene_type:complete
MKLENINLKKLFILLNATHKEVIDEGIKLLNKLDNTEPTMKKHLNVGVWFCKCGWANAFKSKRVDPDKRLALDCKNPNCTLPNRRVEIMYKLNPRVKIIYCDMDGRDFKYKGEAEYFANKFNRSEL